MELNKEMVISEFQTLIDFANFTGSTLTSPCRKEILEYALTIINGLTEENEEWRNSWADNQAKWEEAYEKLEVENDMVRANTVREMYHKIWLEFSDCLEEETISVGSLRASTDQIAKEMLEEV